MNTPEDGSTRPRCYIVTVGASLLRNYLAFSKSKDVTWDVETIEEFGKRSSSYYNHEACMADGSFPEYRKANQQIVGWLEHATFEELEKRCSAELSSLYHGLPPGESLPGQIPHDKVFLVHTNTPTGILCAHALEEVLTRSGSLKNEGCHFSSDSVEGKTCEHLGKIDDPAFIESGISEFTSLLSGLVADGYDKGYDVLLVPTGGYKSLVPYTVLVGMLLRRKIKEVRYLYEDSERLLRLPSLPLGINFVDWHLNAFRVSLALAGSTEAFNELETRSPEIAGLFQEGGPQHGFNAFGDLLWGEYQSLVRHSPAFTQRYLPISGRLLEIPALAQRSLMFMREWENLWEGMRLPQIVSHTRAHCHNVMRLAEDLLGPILAQDRDFLQPIELYLLTAAIWLHDIGHNEHYLEDGDKKIFLGQEGVREKHARLSYQRIARKAEELGFDAPFTESTEAQLVATLCLAHRGPKDILRLADALEHFKGCKLRFDGREYEVRHPVLIASLLSLVDTCDIGVARAGSLQFRKARTKATLEEIDAIREQLRQLPASESEYRRLLGDNLTFLEKSVCHFDCHAQVAWVSLLPSWHDGFWHVDVVIHPTIEAAERGIDIIQHVNRTDFLNFGADVAGFNGLFRQFGFALTCRLVPGEPLAEESVVMVGQ